jgi:NADPH2:quinone reductase
MNTNLETSKLSASQTTMKAVTFDRFGGSEVLRTTVVAKPQAEAGEVLIKIKSTSVNPVDWKIRRGFLQSMLPHHFPIIPGWDAAGTVESVGDGVTEFKVGDRVAAYARLPEVKHGTYAEYISLPKDYLAIVPDSLTFDEAAGLPLVALTALQGLTDYTKVQPRQKVLVLNGAGGVGSFAIQFAKNSGAQVVATTSGQNIDYVRGLGADHVIDYTKENLLERSKQIAPDGFDFVFDAVGGENLVQAYQVVKPKGQLVSIVDTPDSNISAARDFSATFHFVYPSGKALQNIVNDVDAGKVKIPNYEVRSINDAVKAQDLSESHRVRGKIVLAIDFH